MLILCSKTFIIAFINVENIFLLCKHVFFYVNHDTLPFKSELFIKDALIQSEVMVKIGGNGKEIVKGHFFLFCLSRNRFKVSC